tara:strand:+ start:3715 stop:3975 length:261 start_codon:yes stop_codon:yes gene_type:complete
MVFSCYLCEKESVYTSWFCDDCRKVKHIMNCYGKEGVLSILNKTCLRDNKQIEYKIDKIKKEVKVVHVEEQPKLDQMVLRKKKLQN